MFERPDRLVFFVTLEKGTVQGGYGYQDRFLSPTEFQWQSQNRNSQASQLGQKILHSRENGVAHDRRTGLAISALRQEAGLRQTDIQGLSERQVRRYEHGERPSFSAFEALAKAHRLSLQSYLDRLADTIALSAAGPPNQDN